MLYGMSRRYLTSASVQLIQMRSLFLHFPKHLFLLTGLRGEGGKTRNDKREENKVVPSLMKAVIYQCMFALISTLSCWHSGLHVNATQTNTQRHLPRSQRKSRGDENSRLWKQTRDENVEKRLLK